MAYLTNRAAIALAQGLGWFSVGLGLAEMLAPRKLSEQLGMQSNEALLRFHGARDCRRYRNPDKRQPSPVGLGSGSG
jgi:hypothetical protein